MILDFIDSCDSMSVSFGEVVRSQVLNQAFGVSVHARRKGDFSSERHFENLICVVVHERRATNQKLIHENSQGVPICGLSMPRIHYNLRCHIFWSSTEGVGAIVRRQFF